jgi:PhnB protein
MNPVLNKTQFEIDKTNKKIHVSRTFHAPIDRVWKAWTDSTILDQWWAPKPWKAETKSQDFKEGGTWLYSMVGPNGERHWSGMDYEHIEKEKNFSGTDYFCDEKGVKNPSLPSTRWSDVFSSTGDGTKVDIHLTFQKLEDLEQLIGMGFKEGFEMGMNNLDELIAAKHV